MGTKQIGDKYELQAQKILESEGYLVHRARRTLKMYFFGGKRIYKSTDLDFFNLFDLCAKRKHFTRWIQVKYDEYGGNVSKVKPEIAEFAENNTALMTECCEIWWKQPRKEWRILHYDRFKKEWIEKIEGDLDDKDEQGRKVRVKNPSKKDKVIHSDDLGTKRKS